MTNDNARPASTALVVGTYAGSFVVLTVLFLIISMLLPFDNPAMGLLIGMAAAGTAATVWLSREKVVPTGQRVWKIAALCGLVGTVLSALFLLVGVGLDDQLRQGMRGGGAGAVLAILLGVGVLHVLMARLGFWLTFRQALKKKAA